MQEEAPLSNYTYSFQLQTITLNMMLNEDEVIQMEVCHKQSGRVFEVFINQQFINENPFLVVVFGSPKSLFADMLININKISADNEGIITYSILINSKSMPLSFDSKQKKLTKEQKILRLISQLRKDHEQNIDCLIKDQQTIKQENLQLKQKLSVMVQLDKFHESNLMIISELKKFQNNHEELKKQLEKQRNITIQQGKQIITLKVQLQNVKLKIVGGRKQKLAEAIKMKMKVDDKQKMQIRSQKQLNQQIITSINTQNGKLFEMLKNGDNLQLKYLGQSWYGFLLPFALEINKISRFQVRQTKTNNWIMYGVSTDKTIGMNYPYNHLECTSYYARDGRIFQNGGGRYAGAAIGDGTVVTTIADLINWKMSWEVNGNKLAEAEISEAMRAKKLYFIITMASKNDEVEILNY